ncbi:MAG: hypothetical protein Q8O76_15595, partial [Chloroflexota bacterium]|nr:hypothetical protein [Chloroflexota bacterium]
MPGKASAILSPGPKPAASVVEAPAIAVSGTKPVEPAAAMAREPKVVEAEVVPEPDKADSIRRLLARGYSARQIKEQFGYARTTVDEVAADFVPPDNPPARDDDGLPVMRKSTDVMNPEAVLRRYMGGQDEELRGMMKLRAAMLMVMDLVNIRKADADAYAKAMEPVFKMMEETRKEQDAAAERARASSLDTARTAAQDVAGRAMTYMDQKFAEMPAPSGPNPFAEMMARVMEGP